MAERGYMAATVNGAAHHGGYQSLHITGNLLLRRARIRN